MNIESNTPSETVATPSLMNEGLIAYYRDSWNREIRRYGLCCKIINRLGPILTDRVNFSPCVYISITVHTREDLAVLMTLAPTWSKTPNAAGIIYCATVEGEEVQIHAQDEALPGTCKLVEEEYEVPAVEAKPAHTATRMVLKCDKA